MTPTAEDSDESLLPLARAIAARPGGPEALEQLAQIDAPDPEEARALLLLPPERFPDRASVRRFVLGAEFSAFNSVVQHVLIGGVGVPGSSGPIPEPVLERARIAAHALLGDLRLLARLAADDPEGPIAFATEEGGSEERVAWWAALARVAASLASEGAPPEEWQPIFEELEAAVASALRS